MNNASKSFVDIAIDSVRNFASIIGLAGGISYVAGYIIVNFYLGQFGVATLNLVQSRYFSSGALFIVVMALVVSGPVVSGYIVYNSWSKQSNLSAIKSLGLIVLSLLLSAIVIWMCGRVLVEVDTSTQFISSNRQRFLNIWMGLTATEIALLTPIVTIFLARLALGKFQKQHDPLPREWLTILLSGFFLVCFLVGLFVFGRYVYPYTSPTLGGNAPIKAQLILSDYLSNVDGFPITNKNGITETIIIIDQTANSILVEEPTGKEIVEISVGEVIGIIR